MTRVLVAGAAGFIGRHVVDYVLEETDWDVVALDESTVPDLRRELPRVTWIYNVAEEPLGAVDYVINLAAYADAGMVTQEPGLALANVGSCFALLEWARGRPGLKRFVQVSSAEVFGVGVCPFTEVSPVRPLSPYAASKAGQDAFAYAYRKAYDVPVLVSHTANVFGEGQPSARFLPSVVRRALAGEDVLIAPGWRRFIHARDCAAAWVWMLEHAPDRWTHCHVAGEQETDHATFAGLIVAAMLKTGREVPQVTLRLLEELRFGQDGDVVLDPSRLAGAGWRHPLGLEAGVERTVAALLKEQR